MIQRVVNPENTPPNLSPVSDGGTPLNLRTGAEAIGALNLFGDEPAGDSGDENAQRNDDESERGKRTPQRQGNEDQLNADDTDGSQDVNADETDDTETDANDSESFATDGEESGQRADDDESQAPIETLAQLVEALETDPDFLANLTDTFKADGEDVTVSLAELRRGYQRDANYRRQTQELAETRRALEAEHANTIGAVQRELVQVSHVLQQGEALLVGELNTAEMQALRQTNPAEWAARREEIGQRINGIKQLYAQAASQYTAYVQQMQEASNAQLTQLRRTEIDNLRVALPEWGDELKDSLTAYLDDTYGYTADDLRHVFDSRLIVIANKARLYDEMQAVGKKTKQKVTAVPKIQKAGKGGKPGPTRETVNIRKAQQRLKKSGKLRDAADLIGLKLKDI